MYFVCEPPDIQCSLSRLGFGCKDNSHLDATSLSGALRIALGRFRFQRRAASLPIGMGLLIPSGRSGTRTSPAGLAEVISISPVTALVVKVDYLCVTRDSSSDCELATPLAEPRFEKLRMAPTKLAMKSATLP